MSFSFEGGLVLLALLVLGWALGSPLLIGLFASLPFGATAIGSIGGPTPLIATVFEVLLVAAYFGRPEYLKRLFLFFASSGVAWVALALAIYVLAGAIIIPRLLAGQIPVIGLVYGYSIVVPLQPVPSNFNQAMYFVFGIAIFFVVRIVLFEERFFRVIYVGFLTAAAIHAALGMADLGAKMIGIPDVLKPIRTAAFVMHTASSLGGFWRISGGGSEASTFASEAIAFFAFTLTAWRASGSPLALAIALPLLLLLLLSTSTTAYVALLLFVAPLVASMLFDLFRNRLRRRDAQILAALAFGLFAVAALNFAVPSLFGRFFDLLIETVLNKGSSDSANERSMWNANSINAFFLTDGLGVGIGSSRASSWLIAVLSQFGVVGSGLLAVMVWVIVAGVREQTPNHEHAPQRQAVMGMAASIRAAAIAGLIARSLVGGNADPGLIFMASVAFILAAGQYCADRAAAPSGSRAARMDRPGPLSAPA